MPQNLFALVKVGDVVQVRRIRMSGPLQQQITRLFLQQQDKFLQGIDTEISFNGDWKPDANEILVISGLDEIGLMQEAISGNPTAYDDLDLSKLDEETIKALFSGSHDGGQYVIQIQRFMASQALLRKHIPILGLQSGNTFTEITTPMFTFDQKLVAVIQGNELKFKSYSMLRSVCDLSSIYSEATEPDLESFASHEMLHCNNVDEFKLNADSMVRKMVHELIQTDALSEHGVDKISESAAEFPDVNIVINGGKIYLPSDKKQLKTFLNFLLDNIYEAPLSGERYLTNSKRKMSR